MNNKKFFLVAFLALCPLLIFQNCGQPYDVAKTVAGSGGSTGGTGNLQPVGQIPDPIITLDPPIFSDPVPPVIPQPSATPPVAVDPKPAPSPLPPEQPPVVADPSPSPSPVILDPEEGVCEILVSFNKYRSLGMAHVRTSDFERENGGHCSKDRDHDEGEFIAPVDDDDKIVCVTKKACEILVVEYIKHTHGVLLAKPGNQGVSDDAHDMISNKHDGVDNDDNDHDMRIARFKHHPKLCIEKHRKHFKEHDVENELRRLQHRWENDHGH